MNNYWQLLERFKQTTRRKYDKDIMPIKKNGTITGKKWNTEEAKTQQIFFGHVDQKQNLKKHDLMTELKQTKSKLISDSHFKTYMIYWRGTNTTHKELF